MSKFFYLFCHYLMLVSLVLYLTLTIGGIIFLLIFGQKVSWEFFDWFGRFLNWGVPILLGVFAASSKFAVRGFMEHRVEREWEKEDKPESE